MKSLIFLCVSLEILYPSLLSYLGRIIVFDSISYSLLIYVLNCQISSEDSFRIVIFECNINKTSWIAKGLAEKL